MVSGELAGEFSEGFFSQALLGILRKLVVADPHLLPPDAKPFGGADHQLRWGGKGSREPWSTCFA